MCSILYIPFYRSFHTLHYINSKISSRTGHMSFPVSALNWQIYQIYRIFPYSIQTLTPSNYEYVTCSLQTESLFLFKLNESMQAVCKKRGLQLDSHSNIWKKNIIKRIRINLFIAICTYCSFLHCLPWSELSLSYIFNLRNESVIIYWLWLNLLIDFHADVCKTIYFKLLW